MNKKIYVWLRIFFVIPFFSLIFISCSDGDVVKREFSTFDLIPKDDGVNSWLPDFFPKSAKDIKFVSNLDSNEFYIYFSLPQTDALNFNSTLTKVDAQDGTTLLKNLDKNANIDNTWCKLGSNQGAKKEVFVMGEVLGEKNRYLLTDLASSAKGKTYLNLCVME